MRETKFRGKRVTDCEWVYGDLLRIHGVPYIYPDPAPNGWNDYEVIPPDTVGQFTGLLDKNSKKIYEGDIVANDFGNAYIVNMAVEWCTDGYWALHEIDGDDTMHFVADYLKEIELIGNKYDNPELTK